MFKKRPAHLELDDANDQTEKDAADTSGTRSAESCAFHK